MQLELIKANNSQSYSLILNGKTIGFGKIYLDKENPFEIYIEPEYRGNGYGKYLFERMINELKILNYNEVKLNVERKNIQIIKLIVDFGGLLLSQNGDKATYVLPINYYM